MADTTSGARDATYTPAARRFHWWTVALLLIQVPVGLYMTYRGNTLNLWDGLTDALYSSHKALGLLILVLVIARLVYRFTHGAPADEPTITWWQKAAAHVTHWSLYLLLILVPIVGWLGISLYGARSVFGVITIPGLMPQDQDAATQVFTLHKYLAYLIVALVGMHVGGALFHYVIRKDGVLARMLPQAGRRE